LALDRHVFPHYEFINVIHLLVIISVCVSYRYKHFIPSFSSEYTKKFCSSI